MVNSKQDNPISHNSGEPSPKRQRDNQIAQNSLHLTFITFTMLLAIMLIMSGLPLWFLIVSAILVGPTWNMIDGFLESYESRHNPKLFAYHFILLGCLGCAMFLYEIIKLAATPTHLSLAFSAALIIGPIGSLLFAGSMFWCAYETNKDAKNLLSNTFDQINKTEDGLITYEQFISMTHACAQLHVDRSAWILAGLGSTILATAAIATFWVAVSLVSTITFVGLAFLISAAVIKFIQLTGLSEPMTRLSVRLFDNDRYQKIYVKYDQQSTETIFDPKKDDTSSLQAVNAETHRSKDDPPPSDAASDTQSNDDHGDSETDGRTTQQSLYRK